MARRKRRTSNAVMHGSEPLIVREVDPVADHPSLGPLRELRMKKLIAKTKGKGGAKVKVDVKVEAES